MAITVTVNEVEALLVSQTPRLRGMLRMLVGHADDAEDLLQVVFTQFVAKGPPADAPHAANWLFKTARNLALNEIRSRRRRQRREQSQAAEARPSDDPFEAASLRESIDRVRDCLGKLPLELREPLYLHVVENLSLREIAEQIQLGKSTVAQRIETGLVQLNRCFHSRQT